MKVLLKTIIGIVFLVVNITNINAQDDASSRVKFRVSYGIEPSKGTFAFYDNKPTVTEDGVTIRGQLTIYFTLDGEDKMLVENIDSEVIMNKGDYEFKCENGESIYFIGNQPYPVVDNQNIATTEDLENLIEEYERNPADSIVWSIWKTVTSMKEQS